MGHGFEELSNKVIAAAFDVHKALRPGFVEPIYQKAMEVALRRRGIPYLKATGLHVGLLLNFNAPTLAIKRVVL